MTYYDYLKYISDECLYRPIPDRDELARYEQDFINQFPGQYTFEIVVKNEQCLEINIIFNNIEDQVEWKLRHG